MTARPLGPPFSASLFDKTTQWFERARAALLDNLPCRQGCHHCCIGLFTVTVLDRQILQQGLRSLPPDHRRAIEQTAVQQTDMISAAEPKLAGSPFIDRWPDEAIDDLVERYRDLPCPALQPDGSCGVYSCRPLTCRSMGIPTETEGTTEGACHVQSFVPLVRLSRSLREEEEALAKAEAEELVRLRRQTPMAGEELLLPYAFLEGDSAIK